MLSTIMKLSQHTQIKTKCANCGKTIAPARAGSLTAWLFRQAECRCESEQKPEDESTGQAISAVPQLPSGKDSYAHLSGELIGESYEVIEPLGRGGMGEVYRVLDRRSQTVYALKIIAPGLGDQKILAKRLEHEAQAAKSLTHANIASVYDVGRDKGGAPFLIMDYVIGENLEQLLQQEVFLQSQRALEVFAQVAEALVHAHSKGIVHRDLKPSNILLAKSDSGHELVKLVDFGIAKLTDSLSADKTRLTQTGDLIGSPLYMSPEQCRGDELDGRSDIYSFGCIMYEAVSGKPPFSGDNPVRVLLKHVSEPAPRLSNNVRISQSFKAVIERCLEKLPENRYPSAAALLQDLRKVADGKELPWRRRLRLSSSSWPWPAANRKRALLSLVGAVLLFAMVGSTSYFFVGPHLQNTQAYPVPEWLKDHLFQFKSGLRVHLQAASVEDRQVDDIVKLPHLNSIVLDGSRISDSGLARLVKVPTLQDLDLSQTSITESKMRVLSSAQSLTQLELSNNDIEDEWLKYLSQLHGLDFLNLEKTKFTGSGLHYLSAIPGSVCLGGTRSEVFIEYVAKSGLKRVELQQCPISNLGATALAQSPSLESLNIVLSPTLTDDTIERLAQSKTIQHLSLGYAESLTDTGILKLARMKQLKSVWIDHCPQISAAAIEKLRQIPEVHVVDNAPPLQKNSPHVSVPVMDNAALLQNDGVQQEEQRTHNVNQESTSAVHIRELRHRTIIKLAQELEKRGWSAATAAHRFEVAPAEIKKLIHGYPNDFNLEDLTRMFYALGMHPPDLALRKENHERVEWTAQEERDAITYYSKAIKFDANNWYAFKERGRIHLWLNEFDLAIADFNQLVALRPDSAMPLCFRAEAYTVHAGKLDLAMKDCNEVIRRFPNYGNGYYSRSLIWERKKQYDKELSDFNEWMKRKQSISAWTYLRRAGIYEHLGMLKEAIADLEKSSQLDTEPDGDIAAQVRKGLDRLKKLYIAPDKERKSNL